MPSFTSSWSPAHPFRKSDNIIACEQFKHLKPFKPSFEKDPQIYMNWIMGWEYGRIWLQEQKVWEQKNFHDAHMAEKDFIRKNRKNVYIRKKKKN